MNKKIENKVLHTLKRTTKIIKTLLIEIELLCDELDTIPLDIEENNKTKTNE